MRTLLRFAPVLLMFLPASAHALTMEYLTYNAFDETAAAFKRLGLIMSDPGFIVLAGCFVAVSGIGATLMFGTNAIGRGGQGAHPMSMFAPFLIGTVVFWGAVVPKGTLQIYDPVRNKTEAVPDIPALIVLLAGGLSTVEKGMTTMVDTASANPYKDDVGGISYSLIFGAVKASTPLYNLDRSMAQYFKDCGMTAIGSGYNGASMQEVVKGVAGSDLYAAFSKWNHPAWGTVWFQEGNDAGVTGSCADSWAYLDSKLNGEITTVMNPMKRAACESAGFNWSDGAQVAACDTILQDAAAKFDSPTATSEVLLRAIMMGKSITLALNDPDFNVGINTLVNRQMMSEAFGASAAMNQWIPRLRGIMIAVAVGVTPICLLFVATPLVTRALAVVVGLYIWLALWGICDVIAVQMQQDAAFDAFTEVKRHFLGYEAIMNAPEGAVAALGVFGKARTMAMVLATVLCGGLFKLSSSYAFTSMGQQWQGDFNQGGEAAGKQRLQVEQQAALQDQLVNAPGSMGRVQQFGYDTAVGGANYGAQQQFAQYDYLADVTGGVTGDLAYRAGELSGGQALGNVRGGEEYAGRMGMPLGAAASVVAQASAVGSAGSTMGARTRAEQNVPGGYFEATSFESQSRIAGIEVQRGFAGEFEDKGQADGIGAIARQNQASFGGVLDATNGRPEVARDMYGAGTSEQIGRLDTYRDQFGFDPRQVGAAQGVDAAVSTGATEATLRNRGIEAMTAGAQYGKEQSAVIGTTAQQLGGGSISPVADVTGRNQLAGDFGRATAQQKMADFLFGDSTADLAQLHERGASVFSGTLSGDAARRVVDWSEQNGRIPPDQAAALRAKADKGFSVAVGFGESGQVASFNFDGRYSGQVGATHDDTVGMNYGRGDTTTLGDSTAVRQGMSMRGESGIQTLQEFVRRNEGHSGLDQTDSLALANAYAQRLAAEGQTGSASQSDQRNTVTTAGFGANGNAGETPGAKGGGATGALMGALGLNVGVTGTNTTAHGWSAEENYVLTEFSGSMGSGYQQARDAVYERYGTPDTWDSSTRDLAEREIAERWHGSNEVVYQDLKSKMTSETADDAARAKGESEWSDFMASDNKLDRLADKGREVYDAVKDKFSSW